MANNKKNILTDSDNRLIYVEPNCSDRGIPDPEDFSVFVSLTTTSKNRSTLFNGEVTSTQGSSRPIGFIDGTNVGGKRRSLTTNYTEISTTFTTKDKFGKDENDLETLGIESIDISFDTAYTPVIKIKFIDIRGNAVLSKGNDSRYKMFFDLPFPIFDLTVKGFYGKAVKYCLHLTKWNSSFNSSTGNFEIDTEFIGYTYALLTDCLLGYMRATALTKIGKQKFKEYQKKGIKVGGRIVPKYPNLVTIDNLLKYIREIDSEFNKIKSTDENVKQINALDNITDGLNEYKASINNFKKTTIGTVGVGDLLGNNDDNLVLLPRKLYDLLTTPPNKSTDFINSRLNTYKGRQENLVNIINKPITPDLSFLKLKFVDVAVYNAVGYLASDASLNVNGLPTLTEDTFQINPAVNNAPLWDNNAAKIVSDKLKELYKIKNNNEKLVVFDFTSTYKEVERVEELIKIRKKGLEDKLNEELKNAINRLSFKPSIRNIVNVLCIHAQVFLETLAQVSKNAEESENRKKAILKINEFKNSSSKDNIYPWPEYRKNERGILVESWIGASLTEDYDKVNEVVFVDELLQNLMKIARQDEIRELTGSLDSPDFFPVSPAEAKVEINGIKSLITQNPYYQALKGEGATGTHQEAIRCLLFRIFTAGGVSNRLALSPDYSKIIGQLEAENLFKVINKEFTPILKTEFINAINNIGDGTDTISKAKNATEEVIKTWTNGGDIAGVKHPGNSDGKFMKLVDNTYYYKYLLSDKMGPYKNSYIPISGGFHGKDFFNETKTTTNTTSTYKFKGETELKTLSDSLIFTSDNIYDGGSNTSQYIGTPDTDDGSFHLKILVDDDDNNSEFIIPSAQSAKLQEYKDKVGEDTVIDATCNTNNCDLKLATYKNNAIVKDDKLNRYNGIFNTLAIDSVLDESGKKTPVNGSYFADYNWSRNRKYEVTGGFYLASGPPDLTRAPGTTHNINNNELKIIKNEKYIGVFSSVSSNSIGLGGSSYDPLEWVNKLETLNAPTGLLSMKTNVNSLVTGSALAPKIYAPIIDFTVMGDNSKESLSLSLFGSKFYYAQASLEAKAFLYVNSIGWEGIVGDLISNTSDDDANTSLFDLIDAGDGGLDDDTFTIKGLYGNNGSIISAPKLWCVYIGSLIWRFEKGGGGNNNEPDPIIWDTKDNKGTASNPDMYSPDGRMFPLQTNKTYFPATDQYLHADTYENTFDDTGNISSGIFLDMEIEKSFDDGNNGYPKIDKIIRDFPVVVKTEFIRIFENFANRDFVDIAKNYELFKDSEDLIDKHKRLSKAVGYDKGTKGFQMNYKLADGTIIDVFKLRYYDPIGSIKNSTYGLPKALYIKENTFKSILGSTDRNFWGNTFEEVLKNYDNVSPINNNEFHDEDAKNSAGESLSVAGNTGIGQDKELALYNSNHFYFSQFDLTLARNNNNRELIVNDFARTYSVINASPMIFRPIDDFEVTNTNNKKVKIRGKKDYNEDGIRVSKKIFDRVLNNFFVRFEELSKTTEKEDDKIQQRIFNNVDDDIIKLNIYRTLSSINDKWLGSETGLACTNISKIVDSFRFLDAGFLDIGDDFLINPLSVSQKIIGNYNQSFFDLINSILIENNFNFIALPSFIDFTTAEKMKEDVFTSYAWSEKISEEAAGASFICVYVGQKSSNLDLGKDAEHEDDGFTIISDNKCDEATKTMSQPIVQPELFKKEKKQNGYNIPYFVVSYGKGNQSIFKDIKLDQREFTETAESLEIINDLSDAADKTKTSYKGQNLFNIYQKRAYSAEVEMMGNVTIQPMMYFQLNNIPMFKGAYLIYNTTHSITAHNMKTTFKGSRIKKVKTPLITEVQIFQTLIGSLKDGGKATKISDDKLSSGVPTFTGNITSTFQKSKFIKIRR